MDLLQCYQRSGAASSVDMTRGAFVKGSTSACIGCAKPTLKFGNTFVLAGA